MFFFFLKKRGRDDEKRGRERRKVGEDGLAGDRFLGAWSRRKKERKQKDRQRDNIDCKSDMIEIMTKA